MKQLATVKATNALQCTDAISRVALCSAYTFLNVVNGQELEWFTMSVEKLNFYPFGDIDLGSPCSRKWIVNMPFEVTRYMK